MAGAVILCDLILLPRLCGHVVCDSAGTSAIALEDIQRSSPPASHIGEEWLRFMFSEKFVYGGGGALTRIIPTRLYLETSFPESLLNTLPSFIRLEHFTEKNAEFISLIERQLRRIGATGFLGQVAATRLAESFLASVLIDYFMFGKDFHQRDLSSIDDTCVTKAIGFMLHGMEDDWDTATLARKVNLSRSTFVSRFLAALGQSPSRFLLSIRMRKASDLLLKTNLPLIKVATEVGYGSEAAFNRAFRRWFGEPPGHFRQHAMK